MQYSTHGPAEVAPRPATRIVEVFEAREVADHPFFVELRAHPVNLGALWILMANLEVGVSTSFIRWVARTIDHVEDPRIASLLSKQLHDELGHGAFDQIHSVLLAHFVQALEVWRPATVGAEILNPGRHLAEAGGALFTDDSFVMVGAIMTGEIFAKKMDLCLGDEVRRQDAIPAAALKWLVLHETLELAHASDSIELAQLVPPTEPSLGATWRGATTQWDVLWRFLDEVHTEVQRAQIGRLS